MSVHDLNALRDVLLVELARLRASYGRPVDVVVTCQGLRPNLDWSKNKQLARDAGWLLINKTPPFARKVKDNGLGKELFVALTAVSKARAGELYATSQPKTIWSIIQMAPRSDWIAIVAVVVSLIALFK